jgi:hypothetical protein
MIIISTMIMPLSRRPLLARLVPSLLLLLECTERIECFSLVHHSPTRSVRRLYLVLRNSSSTQPGNDAANNQSGDEEGLPFSTGAYLSRLKQQKKELYKNPPVLPPPRVIIEDEYVALPSRDEMSGCLTFPCGNDSSLKALLEDFHPTQAPEEVLRGGSFGGTYFRTIVSAVTNKRYAGIEALKDTVPDEWIKGLNKTTMFTSDIYRKEVNKFGTKCGGSLGMWEVSLLFVDFCSLCGQGPSPSFSFIVSHCI